VIKPDWHHHYPGIVFSLDRSHFRLEFEMLNTGMASNLITLAQEFG